MPPLPPVINAIRSIGNEDIKVGGSLPAQANNSPKVLFGFSFGLNDALGFGTAKWSVEPFGVR